MRRLVGLVATVVCLAAASSCSASVLAGRFISRVAPNSHVLLVPQLQGGSAGGLGANLAVRVPLNGVGHVAPCSHASAIR
jgi:hypothetical protein